MFESLHTTWRFFVDIGFQVGRGGKCEQILGLHKGCVYLRLLPIFSFSAEIILQLSLNKMHLISLT